MLRIHSRHFIKRWFIIIIPSEGKMNRNSHMQFVKISTKSRNVTQLIKFFISRISRHSFIINYSNKFNSFRKMFIVIVAIVNFCLKSNYIIDKKAWLVKSCGKINLKLTHWPQYNINWSDRKLKFKYSSILKCHELINCIIILWADESIK